MTQQYDDTNRGALFRNDKKETANHPDYMGSVNVEGTDFRVSSWIKESKNGTKYMSLSVTRKDSQAPASNAPKPAPQAADLDSDIPF